jgi:hypothetical protein
MATQAESSGVKELDPPLDLSHHFSRVTKNRLPSRVKDFYKYFTIPGIGNLAGGESVLIDDKGGRLMMSIQAFLTPTTSRTIPWRLPLRYPIVSNLLLMTRSTLQTTWRTSHSPL